MASLIRDPFGPAVVMRKAYGDALVELGRQRADVVVLSADVSNSDFSFMFEAAFPGRFFNVGIAEQNMIGTAAGLAAAGKTVFASTFAEHQANVAKWRMIERQRAATGGGK